MNDTTGLRGDEYLLLIIRSRTESSLSAKIAFFETTKVKKI